MYGWVESPGHIRNTLPDSSITIGELGGHRNGRVDQFQNAFERAGLTTKIAPDIESSLWQKLVMVGPWSGVGAITRAPLGIVRSMPETRKLLEGAMREVVAVAQAHGTALPHDSIERASAFLDRISPAAIGNMGGLLNGRPTELNSGF